jgi:hypothetical protein
VDDFRTVGGAASFINRLIDPARRADAEEVKRLLLSDYRRADFQFDWTVNALPGGPGEL